MNKRIAYLNVVCNGSTGKIVRDLNDYSIKCGYDTRVFYGRGSNNQENYNKIDNKISVLFHVLLARLGFNGHGSYFATKKLVRKLKEYNPNIIYMHNIHGYYLNLKVLFKYLKNEYKGRIIWMLHDCWAFTGHCSYFTYVDCNKWQNECTNCPQLNSYPKTLFDTSKKEYRFKKNLFTGLKNIELITPSNWLKGLVSKSFLGEYNIKTIYNGINLDIFKPGDFNDIKDKYNIPKNKKILLGVANIWEERKGLNIFLELSKMVEKDEIIVLVGLNDKQIANLPNNIIGIKRTDNVDDLVSLYRASEVFINPSVEETFSLVTAEAMACGCPVVVSGMSAPKELITSEVGIVVNNHNVKKYYDAYKKAISKKYDKDKLYEYVKKFSSGKMLKENMKVFEEE